jgi:hypothetical protein
MNESKLVIQHNDPLWLVQFHTPFIFSSFVLLFVFSKTDKLELGGGWSTLCSGAATGERPRDAEHRFSESLDFRGGGGGGGGGGMPKSVRKPVVRLTREQLLALRKPTRVLSDMVDKLPPEVHIFSQSL